MLLTGGLDAAPLLFGADDIKSTIAIIAVACAVLLALVNFALDMAAIGATTKKGTLVTDIIRYALETVALILAVIMIFVINQEGIRPGLLMYALLAIAVIQLVIASIRCAVFRPAGFHHRDPFLADKRRGGGLLDEDRRRAEKIIIQH